MSAGVGNKSEALIRAFTRDNPTYMLGCLSVIVAQLTSAEKQEREQGKRRVRELVKIGSDLLQADRAAQGLADFANRNEP